MNRAWVCVAWMLLGGSGTLAQTEEGAGAWSAVSSPTMDGAKTATVENVEIVRDRVHIALVNGTIQFTKPVNGVVFGAVFHGEGRVSAEPPNPIEAHQLQLFTKQDKLNMEFSEATFSFTDGLLEEAGKQVKWKDGGGGDDLYAKRQQEREDNGGGNLPRLFKSVMSPDQKRTAYFLADLKTKHGGWVQVRDDAMQLEEIRVGHWADVGPFKLQDYWMVFPAGGRDPHHVYDDPAARQDFLIPNYQITSNVTDGAELSATAKVTVEPRYSGERVLLFELDSNLRVSAVKDEQGKKLEYHQARERKENSQSHGDYVAVILTAPTQADVKQRIEFESTGKHVVYRVGDGNYFCQSFGWYPAAFAGEIGVDEFAFRSNFELTFRNPKKCKLVATGVKASETVDGKELITTWKSDIPLAAAGFAFGDYKIVTEKVGDVEVQVYANNQPDDLLKSIQRFNDNPLGELGQGGETIMSHQPTLGAIGNLTPASTAKLISQETGNTLRVFQSYFGPYPYKQIAVTNIIGSYGQGWPGLLYLSWLTFLDSTQRNALGIKNQTQLTDFFRGHESSHQWWGHRVGWKSYHDQWLSEGFAEFSGLLYVQYRKNTKEALTQFRLDKERLAREDLNRHKVDELGPIWLGQRTRASVTDQRAYFDLIYSKGGYVLQMIREQMMDSKNADPEHVFKETMQDYCKTFDNLPASTEDFKAMVEKHMTRGMDLDGNHKMDWFFNEYVYGTELPQYSFHVNLSGTADGKTNVTGEMVRTGVPENWKDVVPLYAHMGDKVVRLGTLAVTHPREPLNFTLPQKWTRSRWMNTKTYSRR
jgi:Peptidase family M1 domain